MNQKYILTPRVSEIKDITSRTKGGDNIDFEDLYGDISKDWQYKARRLQARRWRNIKHQRA